ncbi:tyrosine-protein phosphatase [Pseudaestuariivita atlantica]|uniref:Protein tyrosine phosphatase n=1 Tax=Pseudaestuariivita atlantica TaxID=1317121 RepID=A0A0L1JLY9_9RHOB|nr:tyrosine-protein phosphatase [Pseudaestuariivita atlantica]KNG92737.1 protein tyrosine phosphatase [Pseudaestuariivita atlantica]
MLRRLWTSIEDRERALRRSFGKDITTPRGRFWAKVHYHLFDHAFLRVWWTNFWEIAPGVYRSNHPTRARFEKYAAMGIKTVINLRGEDDQSFHLFEKEACEDLGLTLVNAKLWARDAPPKSRFLKVIEALREAERPMMFHCKSGADRAGMVAAIYLMVFEGAPVAEAKKQLGLKYIHLKSTATGIQDYILDVYEARVARSPIGFEEWLRTEYDQNVIRAGWDAKTPPDEVDLSA